MYHVSKLERVVNIYLVVVVDDDASVLILCCQVTLFEQRNFAGRRLDLSADCQKLSDKNFPERCNSVQVESGA